MAGVERFGEGGNVHACRARLQTRLQYGGLPSRIPNAGPPSRSFALRVSVIIFEYPQKNSRARPALPGPLGGLVKPRRSRPGLLGALLADAPCPGLCAMLQLDRPALPGS